MEVPTGNGREFLRVILGSLPLGNELQDGHDQLCHNLSTNIHKMSAIYFTRFTFYDVKRKFKRN
jgi:hypothetical protein